MHQYDFSRCPIILGGWSYTDNTFVWLPGNRYLWNETFTTRVLVNYEFPMISSAIYDNGFVTWAAESNIVLDYQPMIFSKG